MSPHPSTLHGPRSLLRRLAGSAAALRHRERGQVLPIFAIMSVVLLGGAALLTDVAWWWTMEQRMQRAADAGALAGAIYLPGNQNLAFSSALAEAAKNGFSNGVNGVVVTPRRDPGDPRKLLVDVDGPVKTNFAQVFCWQGGPCLRSVDVGVTGAASYVLPVPMGSPENYYGVFGKLRTPGGGTTTVADVDTGWIDFSTSPAGQWTLTSGNVYLSDDQRATSDTDTQRQQWGFGSDISFPASLSSIRGVEVNVEARTTGGSSCQVRADLSWNGGTSWTTGGSGLKTVPAAGLTTSDPTPLNYYVMGGATDLWGRASWSAGNFSAANFRIRLENVSPGACDGTTEVDYVRIKVYYRTSTLVPDANINDPYGGALVPRGLWGTFINQGAEKINGDAYLPKYDPRTSPNAEYDPDTYYNYTIEFPAGSSNGELWIYDPGFCATSGSGQYGTGDRWFNGTSATSAYYTLYFDDNRTPLILSDDDVMVAPSSLFANIRASDESLGGPDLGVAGAATDCSVGATANQSDGRYWHNRWWRMASGLAAGTYRLHTRSTNPSDPNAMNNANGHNSFALWSRATSGSPQIHGLGAMEAFTPLDPVGNATFYLAQIDAEHDGKTLAIRLWDPGDTGALPARLKILEPTAAGYVDVTFTYSAERVASGAASCVSGNGPVTSVRTNLGNNSQFNGCWLEILIPLVDYDAPTPPGETQPGWWKIQYVMEGTAGQSPAFDLTTWQVELRGNPVHLVQG